MDRDRREFVKTATYAGASVALAAALPRVPKAKPMKILILGGTAFLGPQIVEAAEARGHVLTLFNRGKTNPGLFPDIEKSAATATATSKASRDARGTPSSTHRGSSRESSRCPRRFSRRT